MRDDRVLNRTQFWLGLIACLGLAYFAISVLLAMQVYEDYSWTTHFLSDLGKAKSPASAGIFNSALVMTGLMLIPHGSTLAIANSGSDYWIRGFSVLSALGLVFLGLTPWDTHTFLHNVALAVWLVGIFGTIVFYFLLLRAAERSTVVAGMFIGLILFAGGGYVTSPSYDYRVVYQKVLVAACLAWYVHFFAITSTSLIVTMSASHARTERMVTDYLEELTRRHRR